MAHPFDHDIREFHHRNLLMITHFMIGNVSSTLHPYSSWIASTLSNATIVTVYIGPFEYPVQSPLGEGEYRWQSEELQ